MKPTIRAAFLMACVLVLAGDLSAYRVTGTFMYRDRDQDNTGFTGEEPLMPIRGADVEVLDAVSSAVLAAGVTGSDGDVDINVEDSQVRDVVVRVLTTSENNPFLNIQVETWEDFGYGDPYGLESVVYEDHNPGDDLDIGTVTAEPQGPGEPFNIFDCLAYEMMFVNTMTGDNPGDYPLLRARYTPGENSQVAFYNGIIHIGTEFPYDDGIILHEGGHYVQDHWSHDDNPGGAHYVGDVDQDPRLSYAEGMAHFWQSMTAAQFGLSPPANLQVHTTGAPGAGHLDFFMEYEQPNWGSFGPACEVAVAAALYDMVDDPSWNGSVDEDFDQLELSFSLPWYVAEEYMTRPEYTPSTVEDFWDAWMEAHGDTAHSEEMRTLFASHVMEFLEDAFEPDDLSGQASLLVPGEPHAHHTLFPADDADWFSFQGIPGAEFRIAGVNLQPATYALITVYESDGVTPVADNSADVSQAVQCGTDQNESYFVRVNQHSQSGIYTEYGAYDVELRLIQAPEDSAQIRVSPPGLVFLDLPAGETDERSFTVENTGGGPLFVNMSDVERYVEGNPPAAWLSELPESAEIGAGETLDITALVNGEGLLPDTTYDAVIYIDSNDLVNPRMQVVVRVTTTTVGIEGDGPAGGSLPLTFALNQNYPNPFNPSTAIVFDVPSSVSGTVPVNMTIYDTRGRKVVTLLDQQKPAGRYTLHWGGRNERGERVASGVYFYRITAGKFTDVRKMVILE